MPFAADVRPVCHRDRAGWRRSEPSIIGLSTVAGNRVRVHLSSRFGTAPVLMAHVTVAISAHTGGRADGTIDDSDGARYAIA